MAHKRKAKATKRVAKSYSRNKGSMAAKKMRAMRKRNK